MAELNFRVNQLSGSPACCPSLIIKERRTNQGARVSSPRYVRRFIGDLADPENPQARSFTSGALAYPGNVLLGFLPLLSRQAPSFPPNHAKIPITENSTSLSTTATATQYQKKLMKQE